MESQLIISVGREFASAGHEIAEKLAKHYDIRLLDDNLLHEIALEKEVDPDSLKGHDEKKKNKLFHRTVKVTAVHRKKMYHFFSLNTLEKKHPTVNLL